MSRFAREKKAVPPKPVPPRHRTHSAPPPQARRIRLPRWLVTAASTLTTRGRIVLLAGTGLLVSAFLTGQQIQLRLGVLLLATPLVCLVVVSRAQHQMHCSRLVVPARVPVGEPAQITVRVYNDATSTSGVLLAEDQLPAGLTAQTRFVLDRIEPAGERGFIYRTRGRVRGRYPIGPLTVRLADPFGMCDRDRPVPGTDELIVVPVVEPLPAVPLTDYSPGSDNRTTTLPAAGEDDMCTREYRHGDPMHRVHWRSTARRGELMVRREEQPRQSRATVMLDVRAGAHGGVGPESSVEWAVSACASVTAHLVRRGFAVHLLLDRTAGTAACTPDIVPAEPGAEGPLLDALAVLQLAPDVPLRELTRQLGRPGTESLLIAILGELSSTDAEDLARARPRGGTAVAFLLLPHTWDRHGKHREAADHTALLRRAGWRIVTVRQGDPLPAAWTEAVGGFGSGVKPGLSRPSKATAAAGSAS